MDKINILLYFENYITTKGFSEITNEINTDLNIIVAKSLENLKSLVLDNRFDFIIVEDIDFIKYFNTAIKESFEHVKIIIFGEYDSKIESDILIYDSIPKNISEKDIYKKLHDLFDTKNAKNNDTESIISEREAEIVKYVALGFSNKEIAEKLFLSIHTVTTHRKNISKKLGIKTISGLTIYAILNNIISIDDKRI